MFRQQVSKLSRDRSHGQRRTCEAPLCIWQGWKLFQLDVHFRVNCEANRNTHVCVGGEKRGLSRLRSVHEDDLGRFQVPQDCMDTPDVRPTPKVYEGKVSCSVNPEVELYGLCWCRTLGNLHILCKIDPSDLNTASDFPMHAAALNS